MGYVAIICGYVQSTYRLVWLFWWLDFVSEALQSFQLLWPPMIPLHHKKHQSINLLIASFFAFSTKEPHPLKHASESGASYWLSSFSFVINPPCPIGNLGPGKVLAWKCVPKGLKGGAIKCEPPTPSKNLHSCTFNVAKPRCCKATWAFFLYIHKIRSMIKELSGRQLREEISPFIELNSPTDDGTCPVSCEFSSCITQPTLQ